MSEPREEMHTLVDFLVQARRETYAISHGESLDDTTEQMVWSFEDWRYCDRYAGTNPYGGQELVWRGNQVVWMMNYYAEVLSDTVPINQIYAYQREVLGQPDREHLMRGPERHRRGDFAYQNTVDGELSDFIGEETIVFKNEKVYRMRFHGGSVRAA